MRNMYSICEQLKKNAHSTYVIYDNSIFFYFKSLDNVILMMIEAKRYSENIRLNYYPPGGAKHPYELVIGI